MAASDLTGVVTLTNTKAYPFNNSLQIVALKKSLQNQDYLVQTEVLEPASDVGDIVISDKAINGFKIAYTGSAPKVVVRYHIIRRTVL